MCCDSDKFHFVKWYKFAYWSEWIPSSFIATSAQSFSATSEFVSVMDYFLPLPLVSIYSNEASYAELTAGDIGRGFITNDVTSFDYTTDAGTWICLGNESAYETPQGKGKGNRRRQPIYSKNFSVLGYRPHDRPLLDAEDNVILDGIEDPTSYSYFVVGWV
jgi:hypothetical protein